MDAVIKIGGSLQADPAALKNLCKTLREISGRFSLLIVPGGGGSADLVRGLQARHGFSNRAAHLMAILAMDMYGLMIHDLIEGSVLADTLDSGESKRCLIFLPYRTLRSSHEIESSWEVTSDSIAALVVAKIACKRLLLVKAVDGIFVRGQLQKYISTQELGEMSQSFVDPKLHETLERTRTTCWIVNGKHPERIKMILEGKETICTIILRELQP